MSAVEYRWHPEAPPAADVYTTRLGESRYQTLRYWDGARWFEISYSGTRGGTPFAWPKKSRTRKPSWVARYQPHLRRIGVRQAEVQWGEPFRVYSAAETLAYLISIGTLPADWKTAYQDQMRAAKGGAR